jgi:hypothetical protein
MKSDGESRFSASISRIHGLDRPRRMRMAEKEAVVMQAPYRHSRESGNPVSFRGWVLAFAVMTKVGTARRPQRAARFAGAERLLESLFLRRRRLDHHPRLSPPALQIISERQRQVRERADREAPPDGIGAAEPLVGGEDEAEADGKEPDAKDDQRRPHRPVRADGCEQHHRHPEQDEVPGRDHVDVAGNRKCRAVAAHEQRHHRPVGDRHQRHERGGDDDRIENPRPRDRADPVPQTGANVLRDHRAHRRAERHRRHLHIGPQLQRHAECRRGVDSVAVDEADQGERRDRDDDHLDSHREPLDDDRFEDRDVAPQIAELVAAKAQRQVLQVDEGEQPEESDVIGDQRRRRRARDAHSRRRAQPEDEDGVEAAVEDDRDQHEPQRSHAVARAPEHHHQHRQQQQSRHGEEDHPQISERERSCRCRCPEQAEDRRREEPAGDRGDDADQEEGTGGGADDPPRFVDVLPPERLTDQDRRGHSEPEHERDQEEHDHVGVGGRRQRILADEPANPDGVDRAVQRLDDRGGKRRQREREQGLADVAFGEVASLGPCHIRHAFAPLAEPLQRGAIAFGFGGFFGVVGAGFLDRFGLGALDEVGVGQTPGERVALVLGGGCGFREAGFLDFNVDRAR